MARCSELECLRIEMDTDWIRDGAGRLVRERVPEVVPAPLVVVGSARDGRELALNAALPGALAERIAGVFADEPPVVDPSVPPAGSERYLGLIRDALGEVVAGRAVGYVIDGELSVPCLATVVRSTSPDAEQFRGRPPVSEVDEGSGPWAAVTVGDRAVAICATARCSDDGAEAGTSTDPDFRGRGYAAAATAAWASMLLPTGRLLFYSTTEVNRSSMGVADRLGLRTIGWMWKVLTVGDPDVVSRG